MKVLFVYPNIVESPKDISLGLGTLSAVLEKAGHRTALIDSTFGISDNEILKTAKKFKPDVLAITAASNDLENAKRITRLLKSAFDIPSICGGFHPTIAPEETIKENCFDVVCVGEGERALLEFVDSLESGRANHKIQNLWFKTKEGIIRNPVGPLTEELDLLPLPNRELFDYAKYLRWNHGTASFVTTRGCPFSCTYCINHVLQKLYSRNGKYVRYRSIESVIAEIKQVLKKYGEKVKSLEFYDDTFTLDKERVKRFCAIYKKEIGMPFVINARAETVSEEMLRQLKKAGCVRISIGVESGDEKIRRNVLNRHMSNDQIINAFNWARKAGIKTYSFNMVGIPFETHDSIKKTIELNQKIKPDFIGVSIFNAYKGTELYNTCKKNKWLIKDEPAESYFRSTNVAHPNFSQKELVRIRRSFGFNCFKKYRPLRAYADLIDRTAAALPYYTLMRSKIIEILKLREK